MQHEFFIPCAPGLEKTLFREVKELKLPRAEQQVGGVRFMGSMREAWLANLQLRTAVRVLLRLARFPCTSDGELYQAAREIDWSPYLAPNGSFFVDAQVRDSTLTHSQFVAQRTKDGIADEFRKRTGQRPSVAKEDADLRVHVHLSRDRATISVDTSGDSLHKRGWRRYQGYAPLSEILAAAMVLNSNWDRRSPLIDPFCGSGTILIEAILLACNCPAGAFRQFGFQSWPGYAKQGFEQLRDKLLADIQVPRKLRILGGDQDGLHLGGLRDNLQSLASIPQLAEWLDRVDLSSGDALDFELRPGWGATILSNLPYGKRIGEADEVADLHVALGAKLRAEASGYQLGLLLGDKRLAHSLALPRWDAQNWQNGALRCQLVTAQVP